MTDREVDQLVDRIDGLMNEFLSARDKSDNRSPVSLTDDAALFEKVISEGLFPADDPTSASREALLRIGTDLGESGGEPLMHRVYDAYEAKFGFHKANALSARWDSAAGLWYY